MISLCILFAYSLASHSPIMKSKFTQQDMACCVLQRSFFWIIRPDRDWRSIGTCGGGAAAWRAAGGGRGGSASLEVTPLKNAARSSALGAPNSCATAA